MLAVVSSRQKVCRDEAAVVRGAAANGECATLLLVEGPAPLAMAQLEAGDETAFVSVDATWGAFEALSARMHGTAGDRHSVEPLAVIQELTCVFTWSGRV